jgi:hypothetical protein
MIGTLTRVPPDLMIFSHCMYVPEPSGLYIHSFSLQSPLGCRKNVGRNPNPIGIAPVFMPLAHITKMEQTNHREKFPLGSISKKKVQEKTQSKLIFSSLRIETRWIGGCVLLLIERWREHRVH